QRPVAVEGDLELGDPGFREGLRGEKKEAQERKFRSHQGRQSSIGRGFCLSPAGLLPWSTLPIAERRSLSGSDPKTMKRLLYLLCLALLPAQGGSQTATAPKAPSAAPPPSAQVPTRPGEEETMSFEDYDPKSTLVVPQHPKTRAKYPFIDIHNHQDAAHMTPAQVDKLVADMDGLNMAVMNNLSGGWGDELAQGMKNFKGRYPKRFTEFANVDFSKIDEPNCGANAPRQLEHDVRVTGAQGLKIFKNLGMFVKDKNGQRVHTDDPRIDPVWDKCAELGIPVLIHTGEPVAFWSPWDRHNERWLELKQFPGRRRTDPFFASFEQTMEEQHNLFRKHPKTIFIAAH